MTSVASYWKESDSKTSRLNAILIISLIAGIFATRFSIWFPPSLSVLWEFKHTLYAVASTAGDFTIFGFILLLNILCTQNCESYLRNIFSVIFSFCYLGMLIFSNFNVFSMFSIGSPLNMKWFAHINFSDRGLSLVALKSIFTPSMALLFFVSCILVPITISFMKVRLFSKMKMLVFVFIAGTVASLLNATLPRLDDQFSNISKSANPFVVLIWENFYPTAAQRYLSGDIGIDPYAERVVKRENVLAQNVQPRISCCSRQNVVMITIDSVPLKRITKDYVVRNATRFPNFAFLYNQGISFDQFYTNYPSSTEAHGIVAGSVYASNEPLKTSIQHWMGRQVPILSDEMSKAGYENALFMSDDLVYDDVGAFLKGRGFGTLSDHRNLSCGMDDRRILEKYGHKGDDCNAEYAARWLSKQSPKKPFLLWTWFTNTHTPYYSKKYAFSTQNVKLDVLHDEALSDTDHSIGLVLKSLTDSQRLDDTIIILFADHGEAFGEHGLFYHGTSVDEEQTHIPLIIYSRKLGPGRVDSTLGSLLDIAPTITNLTAIETPQAWQGRSLFDNKRPSRVFFSSLSAGRIAGYREGSIKYVLTSFESEPYYYNLASDPSERFPKRLPKMEARIVSARIGAFIRQRNVMSWPKQGSAPN
jgi:arylsulfatase A-like enzyme